LLTSRVSKLDPKDSTMAIIPTSTFGRTVTNNKITEVPDKK
jgi:hypothetical protein